MRAIEREALKYKKEVEKIVKDTWGFEDSKNEHGISKASSKVTDTIKWLTNFKRYELPYMVKLLHRIEYIPDTSIAENLILALERLKQTLGSFDDVSFFPIGDSSGESGGRYLHGIKQYFTLENIHTPKGDPLVFLKNNPNRILVFIDDFIGGGTQAPKYIEEKNIKNTDIYYVAPYATIQGLDKIKGKNLFNGVYYQVEYADDELAFKGSNIFDSDDDLKEIQSIAKKHGEKLYRVFPLGHSNVQSLIVFEKNTPNNSLPIIWAGIGNESNQEIPWNPLFNRRKQYPYEPKNPVNEKPISNKYEDYFLPCSSISISDDYCKKLDFYPKELQDNENLTEINKIFSDCFTIQDVEFDYSEQPCYDNYGALNKSYIMQKFYKDYEYPKAEKIILADNKDFPNMKLPVNEFLENFNRDIRQYKIIFISGDIGTGKSTLIGRLMFDLSKNYNCQYVTIEGSAFPTINAFEPSVNNNNILFLDNLDSFSFSKERFMFMDTYKKNNIKYGFSVFNDGINSVRKIVESTKKSMQKKNIDTLVVSVRPYVLTHFFDIDTLNGYDLSLSKNTMIYTIYRDKQITQKVISDRIFLFQDIAREYIKWLDKNGKKTGYNKTKILVDELLRNFDSIIYQHTPNVYKDNLKTVVEAKRSLKEHVSLDRLYHITAQGYRTIVNIFADLKYNPDLFSRYFSSDILLIFKMGLFKKYCQILPSEKGCNNRIAQGESGKRYNYPNMFLSVSNSEANGSVSCNSTYLTYWLKILILEYINEKTYSLDNEYTPLDEVVDYFSKVGSYSEELVKIALGSLGTINEYNCVEYKFTLKEIRNAQELIKTTSVKLTRRGKYFIREKSFFLFNDIELFIDDWQLPLPSICDSVKNHIAVSDDLKKELKSAIKQNINYDYLLNDSSKMSNFVMSKAKMSIWFVFLVESCRKYEFDFYGIKESYGYDKMFFQEILKRLIHDVNSIIRGEVGSNATPAYTDGGKEVRVVLTNFIDLCIKDKKNIDMFFKKVFEDKVLVECNPAC